MVSGNWTGAMDELLEIIMRDKTWGDAVPRKTFVAILELLTPPKPKANPQDVGKTAGGIEIAGKVVAEQDPQAQLVSAYRRKLSMALAGFCSRACRQCAPAPASLGQTACRSWAG